MNRFQTFAAAALTALVSLTAAASEAVNTDKTGVAIGGHDPVAYFTEHEAQLGDFQVAHTHGDATYWFTSEENKALFVANPKAYLPQFGGYCAFGAALGKKFAASPDVFTIVDGKLYLNLNDGISEVFNGDLEGHIKKANQNWKKIKDVPAGEIE